MFGAGSWARFVSMSARQSESTACRVACPPARVSAIDWATLQKLSPGCTTHSVGLAAGAGDGGATAGGDGGAVVVVVVGIVVVVVGAAVVDGAVAVVVVGGMVVEGAVVVGAVVVGAVVDVTSNASTEVSGDDDASEVSALLTGSPSLHALTIVASTHTTTIHRHARRTARP